MVISSVFDEAVRRQLRILDRRRRTPNNWESMLSAGLTASSTILEPKFQKLQKLWKRPANRPATLLSILSGHRCQYLEVTLPMLSHPELN